MPPLKHRYHFPRLKLFAAGSDGKRNSDAFTLQQRLLSGHHVAGKRCVSETKGHRFFPPHQKTRFRVVVARAQNDIMVNHVGGRLRFAVFMQVLGRGQQHVEAFPELPDHQAISRRPIGKHSEIRPPRENVLVVHVGENFHRKRWKLPTVVLNQFVNAFPGTVHRNAETNRHRHLGQRDRALQRFFMRLRNRSGRRQQKLTRVGELRRPHVADDKLRAELCFKLLHQARASRKVQPELHGSSLITAAFAELGNEPPGIDVLRGFHGAFPQFVK